MPVPELQLPNCDVPGCGHKATICTDGSEIDTQDLKRPAIKNINVCDHHQNWPHSSDAIIFSITSSEYQKRGA